MVSPELLSLIVRLAVGALATFFAILLWANTRDSAWMFVVIGTIINYGDVMYTTFRLFGIVAEQTMIFGIPLITILLGNLPSVCFLVAFIIVLTRNRAP